MVTGEFHTLLTAPGATPQHYLLFLHGILGSRSNWRGFARKVLELRPDWGAMLVDLRGHGQRATLPQPPPHTLAAVVQELCGLVETVESEAGIRVGAIAGHSFGGKVATLTAQARLERGHGSLSQLWILDSPPGSMRGGSDSTRQVFALLPTLPQRFERRQDFVARLEEEGIEKGVAQWLATNLEPVGDASARSFRFRLDLAALQAMLDDFFACDTWPVLRRLAGPGRALSIEIRSGGRSEVFRSVSPEDLAALIALGEAAGGRVQHRELARAGHWLHVDEPRALAQEFAQGLPSLR